jgi:hypothetical protein
MTQAARGCKQNIADGGATADELAARADEVRKAISRAVWSIKRRKNWQ